ncbi:MAG: hypothetical protein WCI27_03295 [Candidatus Omnitrophota bacterium]
MLKFVFMCFIFLPSICFAAEQITTIEMQDALALRARGNAFQAKGAWEQALFFYEQADAVLSNDAYFFNDKGLTLEHLGKMDAAEHSYLKALEIDFKCLPAYSNLGYFYEHQKNYDLAIQYFSKRVQYGISRDPWTLEAQAELEKLTNKSPLLLEKKKVRERLSLENEVACRVIIPAPIEGRIDHVNAEMDYQRSLEFFAARRYDAAENILQSCLQHDPEHKPARHLLSRIKNLQTKKLVTRKASSHGDPSGMIAIMEYDKGLRLMKDGYREEAIKAFNRALVFAPADTDIQEAMAHARGDE